MTWDGGLQPGSDCRMRRHHLSSACFNGSSELTKLRVSECMSARMSVMSSFWTANPQFKSPGYTKVYKAWNGLWKTTWKTAPYNGKLFEHYFGNFGSWTSVTYWLMSVIERAKSTDPEKIISVWENDTYKYVNGKV
ncbi:MAG: hypothetical protein HY835_04475, partial [Anaerolineae bacterium]|nr:hypothetical protein [Anaerolineae bacterium]